MSSNPVPNFPQPDKLWLTTDAPERVCLTLLHPPAESPPEVPLTSLLFHLLDALARDVPFDSWEE
jgi:hypothetical protein